MDMDERFFTFNDNQFNQGEYAQNKMREIELMNMENIQKIEDENNKELKL